MPKLHYFDMLYNRSATNRSNAVWALRYIYRTTQSVSAAIVFTADIQG